MSANVRASTANGTPAPSDGAPKTYYESQREMLVSEIAQSLEQVLQNINRLNRSLEEVIQVGNEFAPVESLWSHFETVMGQREDEGEAKGGGGGSGRESRAESRGTEGEVEAEEKVVVEEEDEEEKDG